MNKVKALPLALILAACQQLPARNNTVKNYPPNLGPGYVAPPPKVPETEPDEKTIDDKIKEKESKEDEKIETEVTYFSTLSSEYKALLDVISWAEYTTTPCLGNVSSYQILVNGKVKEDPNNRYGGSFGMVDLDTGNALCSGQFFVGYDDHPRIKVGWGRRSRRSSDAAGRYQWLSKTYDSLRARHDCGENKDEDCGLFKTGIWPDEQDKAAIFVIKERGVTQQSLEIAIVQDDFKKVWKKLAKTWASLPYYNWHGRGVGYYRGQRNSRSFTDLRDKFLERHDKYIGDNPVLIIENNDG